MNPRLDYEQIEELLFYEKTTEEPILGPMLELFETQIFSVVPKMIEANAKHDGNEISRHAHFLKSGSGQLGLKAIHQLCLELETEGRHVPDSDFQIEIDQILNQASDDIILLREYLLNKKTQKAN